MPYRVNGQYIMEGLASRYCFLRYTNQIWIGLMNQERTNNIFSFMFTLGGAGMIILDQTHNPTTPKFNRLMLQFVVRNK